MAAAMPMTRAWQEEALSALERVRILGIFLDLPMLAERASHPI